MLGWLISSIARLIVFGERLQNIPITDVRFMQYRARLIKTSIFITLLIHAFFALLFAFTLEQIPAEGAAKDPSSTTMLGLSIGAFLIFWGLRFVVTPVLAAVDYPIGTFLKQAQGYMISCRLLGILILISLPVMVIMQLLANPILTTFEDPGIQNLLLIALVKPFSVLVTTIINAGYIFALQEMLGQNKKI